MAKSPLIIDSPITADSAVIWLHGLGASQQDFAPVAHYLQQLNTPSTRYILPQAPDLSVTLNGGYVMPAWYDLIDLTHPRTVKVEELDAAARTIRALIDDEVNKGIAIDRIFLAGFSQGGAVVLHTAYVHEDLPLGGVLALSTYFPTSSDEPLTKIQQSIPSIHLHGTLDPVVPIEYGKAAKDALENHGVNAAWHTYPMRHEASEAEIQQIGQWLAEQLTQSEG